MAETDSGFKADGRATGKKELKNTGMSIGTTTTKVLSQTDASAYNKGHFLFYNGNASETVTYKIWGSPLSILDSSAVDIDGTNATQQWDEITDDIAVSSSSTSSGFWTGTYNRIAVTATASASTSSDNNAYMTLFRLK